MFDFYEFFAGGGMARAGLGDNWRCLFANDIDPKKGRAYAENWGADHLIIGDVKALTPADLPGRVSLSWGSFPCQDLSLAGAGAGLKGERSSTFWPFWRLMTGLIQEGRAPTTIVLENVAGALASNDRRDFAAICSVFEDAGYRFGALVIDAALFLPQSRPRLFIIAVRRDHPLPPGLVAGEPIQLWSGKALAAAYEKLSPTLRRSWIWWSLPAPPLRNAALSDLIEKRPTGVAWHSPQQTRRILDMMSDVNRAKVEEAKTAGRRMIGGIYKRTRRDAEGGRIQRAEVRFDDVAGCLRTPAGGSSRQLIMVVEGDRVRSRLISSRETARLMGLPDDYKLPSNYNEAYHLTGDGVVVPVVRHIATHILEPILRGDEDRGSKEAA